MDKDMFISAWKKFWPKVDRPSANSCWVWTGTRTRGYGQLYIGGGVRMSAHRLAWILTGRGPIRSGLHVLHRCDNPPCCNPRHLFLGTARDNIADCISKGRSWWANKTHCSSGHPYDDANTHITNSGQRKCRTCNRIRARIRRARMRGETIGAAPTTPIVHVQRTRPLIVSGRRGCSRVPDIAQHRWKDGRDVGKAADPSLSRVVTDAAHADHVKGDVIGLHATQPSYGCAGDNS